MNYLLAVTFLGFAVGIIGTCTGGAMAFVFRHPSNRLMGAVLGLSSGLMISIVCFDLLPEAFEIGSLAIGITGILFGTGIITLIDQLISLRNLSDSKPSGSAYIRTGVLLGIGIAIHNFPEGLAIGSGLVAATRLGINLAIVIAFHNIPEGIAMATPMLAGGYSRVKIFIATVMAGIPMGFGALTGSLLGELSAALISFCLAFAGGAMLFITCGELIPRSQSIYKGRASSFGIILGIIGGIVLSLEFR